LNYKKYAEDMDEHIGSVKQLLFETNRDENLDKIFSFPLWIYYFLPFQFLLHLQSGDHG